MKFEDVLPGLRAGRRYRRAGWKNAAFVFLVPGREFQVNRAPLLGIFPEGHAVQYAPHIDVVTTPADGVPTHVSTWSPWMGDLLAEDWQEICESGDADLS